MLANLADKTAALNIKTKKAAILEYFKKKYSFFYGGNIAGTKKQNENRCQLRAATVDIRILFIRWSVLVPF